MCCYVTKVKHIDISIKRRRGSFRVEEIIDHRLVQGEGGLHLYKVFKPWGIPTYSLVKSLSKYGAKSLGRKDKYAEAVIHIITTRPLPRDKYMEYLGRIDLQIKPEELHIGNVFRIVVEISGKQDFKEHVEAIIDEINKSGGKNIPNYFGYQRFGVNRINHLVLNRVLRRSRSPSISKDKIRIYAEAYQAYLFNIALSKRIRRGVLTREIEIPIPGYALSVDKLAEILEVPSESASKIKKTLLKARNLGINTYGGLRRATLDLIRPITTEINEERILIEFGLSRGQYATVLLRELFKPLSPRKAGF